MISTTHETSDSTNFSIFKDCIARRILARPEFKDDPSPDPSSESSELSDFAHYLSLEAWPSLPPSLRAATYESRSSVPEASSIPLDAVSASFSDTLISYGIASDLDDVLEKFLRRVVGEYVEEACAPPPVWKSTRTDECEICAREVKLTYHHLIPKSTHAKVLKKKWHPESRLNSVAWLCRQCHSAVHHAARCEDLARNYYTIELLLEREDIQRWQKYAAKQRFGTTRAPSRYEESSRFDLDNEL